MPELAAIIFSGLLVCVISTLTVFYLENRRFESFETGFLQSNLKLINKRWNSLKQCLEDDSELNCRSQKSSLSSTILIFGFGMSLLSWIGLVFFWMTYLSIRLVSSTRKERSLLNSDLSTGSLNPPEIQNSLAALDLE